MRRASGLFVLAAARCAVHAQRSENGRVSGRPLTGSFGQHGGHATTWPGRRLERLPASNSWWRSVAHSGRLAAEAGVSAAALRGCGFNPVGSTARGRSSIR